MGKMRDKKLLLNAGTICKQDHYISLKTVLYFTRLEMTTKWKDIIHKLYLTALERGSDNRTVAQSCLHLLIA